VRISFVSDLIFIGFALVYCSRTFFYVLGITPGHPDTIDDKQRVLQFLNQNRTSNKKSWNALPIIF